MHVFVTCPLFHTTVHTTESPEKQPTSPSRERTPVEQKRKIKDTSAYQYTHTFDPTAEGEEAFIQRGLAEEVIYRSCIWHAFVNAYCVDSAKIKSMIEHMTLALIWACM